MTFDPETAEIRLLIATHPLAAVTLQPSKLRHLQFTIKRLLGYDYYEGSFTDDTHY